MLYFSPCIFGTSYHASCTKVRYTAARQVSIWEQWNRSYSLPSYLQAFWSHWTDHFLYGQSDCTAWFSITECVCYWQRVHGSWAFCWITSITFFLAPLHFWKTVSSFRPFARKCLAHCHSDRLSITFASTVWLCYMCGSCTSIRKWFDKRINKLLIIMSKRQIMLFYQALAIWLSLMGNAIGT